VKPLLLPLFVGAMAFATAAVAHLTPATGANQAGFEQRLGERVPRSTFRDERDKQVTLADYYASSPIVLVFAWYGCTTLCPTVVGNLAQAVARSGLDRGRYQVVVVSIDPRDAPADALRMKRRYLAAADADRAAWHLLTGSESAIAALANAVGFRYVYDDDSHQYAHPAGLVLVTPHGDIARYIFGFDYTPAALHDGIEAAAAQEIASPAERLLLLCFHFAPAGRYSMLVLQTLRVASVVLIVAALAVVLVKRRRLVAR
jgi:protein SCO1